MTTAITFGEWAAKACLIAGPELYAALSGWDACLANMGPPMHGGQSFEEWAARLDGPERTAAQMGWNACAANLAPVWANKPRPNWGRAK